MTTPIGSIPEGIRELGEKATVGPWGQIESGAVHGDRDADGWTEVAATPAPRSPPGSARYLQWQANAAFIVACVNYVRDQIATGHLVQSPGEVRVASAEEEAVSFMRSWHEEKAARIKAEAERDKAQSEADHWACLQGRTNDARVRVAAEIDDLNEKLAKAEAERDAYRDALTEIRDAWTARARLPDEDGVQALKDIAREALR